jgi:hypothetical protein
VAIVEELLGFSASQADYTMIGPKGQQCEFFSLPYYWASAIAIIAMMRYNCRHRNLKLSGGIVKSFSCYDQFQWPAPSFGGKEVL